MNENASLDHLLPTKIVTSSLRGREDQYLIQTRSVTVPRCRTPPALSSARYDPLYARGSSLECLFTMQHAR